MFWGHVASSNGHEDLSYKISGSDYPVSICHIPEEWNHQLYHCKALKTHIQRTLFIWTTYSQAGYWWSTEQPDGRGVQQLQSSMCWLQDVKQYHPRFQLPDLMSTLSFVLIILLLISVRKWNSLTRNHVLVQKTCCNNTATSTAKHNPRIRHLHIRVCQQHLAQHEWTCTVTLTLPSKTGQHHS